MAPPPQSMPNPALAKAIEYHKAGQFERALKNYRRVLKQNPSHVDALVLGGQAAFQAGHTQEGIRWLSRAVEKFPSDPQPSYNLGVVYKMIGDRTSALDAFKQAVQIAPGFAAGQYNAGITSFELGLNDEALVHLESAIASAPDHADAFAASGFILREQGRLEDAISAYQSAVRIAPGHAQAWAGLGVAYQEARRLDDAIEACGRSCEADPDYSDAIINLADVYIDAGRPNDAVAACDDFLARHPADAGVLASKTVALNDAGRKDELRTLCDLERYVQAIQPGVPAGFSDMQAFNHALSEHVLQHKTLVFSPASQATREGKHTGTLNEGVKGPIAQLEKLIGKAVDTYMEALGSEDEHPIVIHRPRDYKLFIWAVVLEGKGYQLPHIHPSAWLSGVYYARVPGIVDDGGQEGWIEFGQPGPEFHFTADPELRLVKPEPGLMVMFPSFMFHRTVPFESDETRISVAFDVVAA